MDWIKRHPYLSGGLVLVAIVLFVIIRKTARGGGASAQAQGPSESLQAAQLAAGVQQAGIAAASQAHANDVTASLQARQLEANTAVAVAGAQRDVALQSILASAQSEQLKSQTALGVASYQEGAANAAASYQFQAAQAAVGGQVQIAQIGADTSVTIAGLQADIAKLHEENALAATKDINATALKIQGVVSGADVTKTLGQQAVDTHALDIHLIETQVGAKSKLDLASIQGKTDLAAISSVTTLGLAHEATSQLDITTKGKTTQALITTIGGVETHALDVSADIAKYNASVSLASIGAQHDINSQVIAGLNRGQYGNTNRAAVVGAIVGGPGTAQAIESGQAATSAARYSFWGNLVNSLVGGATKVLAPAP